MIRAILCTLALTVALTAASAQAGKFKIKIGGGNGGGNKHHNFNWNNHHNNQHHNKHHHHHYHKYHAPVVQPSYYQVCYYHPSWTIKKHEIFTSLHEAQIWAVKVQHLGYIATVSKYDPHYNSGLGHGWVP